MGGTFSPSALIPPLIKVSFVTTCALLIGALLNLTSQSPLPAQACVWMAVQRRPSRAFGFPAALPTEPDYFHDLLTPPLEGMTGLSQNSSFL